MPLPSPAERWALTPPFHPYLRVAHNPEAVFFLLHCLSPSPAFAAFGAFPLGSTVLFVVRTFLPADSPQGDKTARTVRLKLVKKHQIKNPAGQIAG